MSDGGTGDIMLMNVATVAVAAEAAGQKPSRGEARGGDTHGKRAGAVAVACGGDTSVPWVGGSPQDRNRGQKQVLGAESAPRSLRLRRWAAGRAARVCSSTRRPAHSLEAKLRRQLTPHVVWHV